MWLDDLHLIDPETGSIDDVAVEIRGQFVGEIASIPPANESVESLGGAYVLPGLICCHTHLQGIWPAGLRDESEPAAKTALRAAWRAKQTLEAGVTTVRCLHEQSAVDIALRHAIEVGQVPGPRIFAAGRALSTKGGHGDGLGSRIAGGHDGFLAAAREELKAGADHVKVFASGGLTHAGESLDEPQMTLDEMIGAVAGAEEYGTYVTAHAAGSATIRRGIEAGIRSFEHAYRLDQETAELMASTKRFLTPTLVVTQVFEWMARRGFDEEAIDRSRATSAEHLESIGRAIAAGVTLVMGTDFPPGSSDRGVPLAVREMEMLVLAGLSPLGAIQAATSNAAVLLGNPDLGRIRSGGQADLIVIDGNPISDISAMERITTVISSGLVVRRGPIPGNQR